jgi:hypothetical protein
VPYQSAMALLMQIPGVDWVVAAVVIAEIGTDMSVFISVYHLVGWAGLCPSSHESAGKRRNVSVRKGNMHLPTILVGAARTTACTKGRYFKDKIPPQSATRRQRYRGCHCAQDPGDGQPHAVARRRLSRPPRDLPRSDRPDPNRRKPQAAAGAPCYVVSIQPKEAVPNPVEAAA